MSMRMGWRILSILVCTIVFVSIATAHEVTIGQRAKIGNGPEIQPGKYQVEVVKTEGAAKVSFYKGGDLVLTVPATLTKEEAKNSNTEIHTEAGKEGPVIVKIRLQGSKESLVFGADTPRAE